MTDITTTIERWLRRKLANGPKSTDFTNWLIELSNQLEAIGHRRGFRVVKDVFVTSRCEEGEVGIAIGALRHTVEVCLVPIIAKAPTVYVR